MKKMTRRGTTVEEAISQALDALGVTREQVQIDVIDEGRKGFFGIGAKEAEVTVTVKEDSNSPAEKTIVEEVPSTKPEIIKVFPEVEELEQTEEEPTNSVDTDRIDDDVKAIAETKLYIQSIASQMKIDDLEIEEEIDGKYISLQLKSEKAAVLIGKRGQTLNAMQQLAQLIANKYTTQFKVIRLNVDDYRERREQSLEQLADRMADKAVRTGRKVQLEPMPSYERKVIHNALSNRLDIETYSEGTDPYRYLIIEPIR